MEIREFPAIKSFLLLLLIYCVLLMRNEIDEINRNFDIRCKGRANEVKIRHSIIRGDEWQLLNCNIILPTLQKTTKIKYIFNDNIPRRCRKKWKKKKNVEILRIICVRCDLIYCSSKLIEFRWISIDVKAFDWFFFFHFSYKIEFDIFNLYGPLFWAKKCSFQMDFHLDYFRLWVSMVYSWSMWFPVHEQQPSVQRGPLKWEDRRKSATFKVTRFPCIVNNTESSNIWTRTISLASCNVLTASAWILYAPCSVNISHTSLFFRMNQNFILWNELQKSATTKMQNERRACVTHR